MTEVRQRWPAQVHAVERVAREPEVEAMPGRVAKFSRLRLELPESEGARTGRLVREQELFELQGIVREANVVDQAVESALIAARLSADRQGRSVPEAARDGVRLLGDEQRQVVVREVLEAERDLARTLAREAEDHGGVVGAIELDQLVGENLLLHEITARAPADEAQHRRLGCRTCAAACDPKRPARLLLVAVPLRDDRSGVVVLEDRADQEAGLEGEIARVEGLAVGDIQSALRPVGREEGGLTVAFGDAPLEE